GARVVVWRGRPSQGVTRPQISQQLLAHTVFGDTVGAHYRGCLGLICCGRLRAKARQADRKSLLLECEEDEQFVLQDRPAKRKSVVIVAIFLFLTNKRGRCSKCFI